MTTIDSKKIFVINGSGGVGKDTFVQFVSEFYCRLTNKQVINYSSVDEIKKNCKRHRLDRFKNRKRQKIFM